jgi:hypothetical protein
MTDPIIPAPVVPGATMKALEALEARLAALESEWKDGKLEIARLKVALDKPPAPAAPKGRLLRDR